MGLLIHILKQKAVGTGWTSDPNLTCKTSGGVKKKKNHLYIYTYTSQFNNKKTKRKAFFLGSWMSPKAAMILN